MVTISNLKEDLENMYSGMVRVGEDSDIWQNKLIYNICKANYDILETLIKMEKNNDSQGNC